MAYSTDQIAGWPYLYKEGFMQALQQKSSRARAYVTTTPVNGRSERFGKIDKITAERITTEYGETNPSKVAVDWRTLNVAFSKSAKRLDRRTMLQLASVGSLQNPTVQAQYSAAGRDFDATLVTGLLGVAYEGEFGQTPVPFPTSQEIAVNYNYNGGTGNTGLTFDKLNRVDEMMGVANVAGQDIEGGSNIIGLITHKQLTDLRNEIKLTSHDYQAIKPLATGNMYDVMGKTLICLDPALLPYDPATGIRQCVFYAKDHVMFGIAENPVSMVDQLIDGNYDWQLYLEWGWGATRLFDEAVVKVFCDEIL